MELRDEGEMEKGAGQEGKGMKEMVGREIGWGGDGGTRFWQEDRERV